MDPIIAQMQQDQSALGGAPASEDDDPIIQQMKQAQGAQTSRAALAVGFASNGNADRSAENLQLAKRFSVPSDVVDKWPDQFRQYAITDAARDALQKAPVLQGHIATNPDLAKVLHDDVPNSSALEQSITAWNPSVGQRFTGWMKDVLGVTGINRAKSMNELAARESGMDMNQARDAVGGASEVPEQALGGFVHGATFGVVPNVAGDAQSTMGKVGEGAGDTLGFMYGGPVKAASWGLGKIGLVNALKVAEADSRLMGAAKIIAAESATVGAASALGATGNAIDSDSVGQAAGKVGMAGATGAATGAVFGAVKNVIPGDGLAPFLGRWAANTVGTDLTSGNRPWDDRSIQQKVFDYGINGLFSIDGAHPMVRDAARADFALDDAQKVAALSQLAGASEFRRRAPDEFKQWISDVADQTGTPDLYVDAKTFTQVLDQSGIKGEELISQMPEVARQMREGLMTEGMVKIPLEDYATHIAGSPVDAVLQDHLRTDPQGMTLGEAKVYYQEQAAKMKAASEEAVGEKANDELFKASGQKVEDAVRAELDKTGRFHGDVNKAYASMWRAFFDATAAKEGVLPHELFDKYNAEVRADHLPGGSDRSFEQPGSTSVEGYHYSKQERSMLTTGLFGTDLAGSAKDEILNHPDKRLQKRLSFYVDKGTGVNPEAGVGGYAHKVRLTNLYDANSDPLRLRTGNARDFESKVLDHGYSGYLDRMDGTQSAHAILLGDHTLTPEKLGPQTKLKGEVVGPAPARASVGRDVTVDALKARTDLPAGFMPREAWDNLLAKMAPEEHAALKAAGVFEGDQKKGMYKSDLIKDFESKTEKPDYTSQETRQQVIAQRFEQAAKTSDVDHKRESNGRYVGAPDKVGSSPQKLAALRKDLEKLTREGEHGRYWYENSAREVMKLVGGNKADAEKFIGLLAIFSPRTPVSANTSYAIKAWYQWKNGEDVKSGGFPNVMGARADAWLNKGEDWGGIKTNNFYKDLMEEIDPSKVDDHHSTMDMWMALAGDYGSKVLDQGPKYMFMQREIKRIADAQGWRPHQVQAAIWSAIKARVEGSETERKAYELKKGISVLNEKGNPEVVKGQEYNHYRAATKFGIESPITQAEINARYYDFATALQERQAQVSWEATPGVTSGVLPGIHDAPMHQQVEYLTAIKRALTGENGRDLIDDKLGLLTTEGEQLYSGWQGKTTAGIQQKAGVLVDKGAVTGQSRIRVNLAADIRGLALAQEGVAWHFPIFGGAKYGQNGVEFKIGRPLTAEETKSLYDSLTQELGHSYAPPIPTLEGFRVLNFPDEKELLALSPEARAEKLAKMSEEEKVEAFGKPNPTDTDLQKSATRKNGAFHEAVLRAIDAQPFKEEVINGQNTKFETDGELRSNNWDNGDADYRKRIADAAQGLGEGSDGERPDLLRWVDNELSPRVQAVNDDFAQRYGWDKPGSAEAGRNTLDQSARGQISFGKDITQQPSIISLLKGADLSTFLHESGHFFLEVTSDLASKNPEGTTGQDFQKLLDWFGVKDADTWRSMTPDDKRQFHEQFARGFESYLMEGKAPTVALQGVFGRFRSWLMSLYKNLGALDVQLTPEVRGVMDRMLASEEQIKQTEQIRGLTPLFTEKPEGMTADAWSKYQEENQQATEQGVADLQAKSIKDMQWMSNAKAKVVKALNKEAREQRASIKTQVTKEVSEMPAFAAKDFLRENKEADPEMVAEKFGFSSAEEMAQAIADHGNKKDVIEGMTDQRMLEQHGELIDPRSIERAAEAAIHNDVRTRVLARELNALAKVTGSPRLLAKAAGEAADAAINAKKVGEVSATQYQVAEGRAGKAAMDALKKGDTQTAAIQKRAQLLNNTLAKKAAEAQEAVSKILTYMKRFDRVATLKAIDPEERDQILKLLSNYDFRKNLTDAPTRAQQNLQQWLESQQQAGYTPLVDAAALEAQPRTQYRDLTVEQIKGLYDTVRSIEKIGKAKTQADWQGNRVSLDELVKNTFIPKMLERGNNFDSDALYNKEENRTASPARLVLDKMASFLRATMAELKPQYFKSNHYDLHEILGPFHELFDQVFNANYRKVDMTRAQSQTARALAETLGKDWQKSIFDKVGNTTLIDLKASEEQGKFVPLSLTRDNLMQMVAHAGNESNFDKLTKGYGWKPEELWKFLDGKLSAKDVEAIKAQWEMANAHWPEVKAMYERMGQVVPPKVEARPFQLRLSDGTTADMPGGYLPIRYDPLRSRLGEKKQAERSMSPDGERFGYDFFGRDTTTNGSMNARVDGYTDAIDISHNAFERAMAETIHDLAYRETLVNTNKIITHPEFRKQFYKTYGREDYDALHTWLGRIANSENMDSQVGNLGRIMRYTRTGMVMNAIALRASTVLKHGGSAAIKTTGYFIGGGEKYYLARQAAMATDYKAQLAEAVEKFPEIRARALQQDRDYRETVSSLYTADGLQAKAERFGHAAVAWADLFTATATAHGAYDRAIAEGIPTNMGGTGAPMTHAQAVSYANQIVREAHGSQIESMRSNVMTNPHEGVKMFTTLYGFMNNTLGQTSDTVSKMKTAGLNKPEVMARALMALVVPALWAGVLTDGMPNKDDWKSWLGKALGSETLGMVPFARDAYSFLEGYKHAGVIGVESWMQAVLQPVLDAKKAVEGKNVPGAISHAADAIGMGLHIPGLGQLGKTAQYLWDVHTGKQQPASTAELVQGATVGIHKPKP